MAATKKATKKTATKRVTKQPKITLKDDTLYVLSIRDKLFFWKPVHVYETSAEAHAARTNYENQSHLAFAAAKVDRVKLAR